MYNLTVEGAHTFFVGEGQWLVHNCNIAEEFAANRATQLQEALPVGSQGRVTMAVGVVEDAAGNRITLIGTSEPGGYLRPGVRDLIQPGEVVVPGTGHAEADVIAYAQANGYKVITVGAGRPICPNCATTITGAGATPATPLKRP